MRALIVHPLVTLDQFFGEHLHRANVVVVSRAVNNRFETAAMVDSVGSVELNLARHGVLQPICVISGGLGRFALGYQAAENKLLLRSSND